MQVLKPSSRLTESDTGVGQHAGTRTGLPDDGCVLKCETRRPSGYWCEKDLLSRIWPSPYGHTEQRAKPRMPKSKLTALPERSEQGRDDGCEWSDWSGPASSWGGAGNEAPGPVLAVCTRGGTGTVFGPVRLPCTKWSGCMLYFSKLRSSVHVRDGAGLPSEISRNCGSLFLGNAPRYEHSHTDCLSLLPSDER